METSKVGIEKAIEEIKLSLPPEFSLKIEDGSLLVFRCGEKVSELSLKELQSNPKPAIEKKIKEVRLAYDF